MRDAPRMLDLTFSLTFRLPEWCENDLWFARIGGFGVRARRRFEELSSQVVKANEIHYISDLELIDGKSHATGESMCKTLHHVFRWFISKLGQFTHD